MKTVLAGTSTTGPLVYTTEQEAAIETMKQDGLQLGAARPEFVNAVLCPDGSVIADPTDMITNAEERVQALVQGGATDPVSLAAALEASRKLEELHQHLAENRFLFVVDAELTPLIYFQCAVPGNPDVY